MHELLEFLALVSAYWLPVLWVTIVVASYLAGGWRSALAAFTLGASHLAFRYGKKSAKDDIEKQSKIIEENREKEYDKIDNRATSRSDVADRLRDGSF